MSESLAPSLPIEIIDHILSHIDEPADLLPFLLVSKPLNALADNHIQFRVVRCPLGLIGLWDCLSQTPSWAEKVRVLEIQKEQRNFNDFNKLAPAIVPREYVEEAKVLHGDGAPYVELDPLCLPALRNAERALIRALKNMSGLQIFKWDREPPLFNSRLDDVHDDIWTALQHCANVTEVEVLDSSGEYLNIISWSDPECYGNIRNIHNSLMFTTLTNLTRFVYKTDGYIQSGITVPLDAMAAMLLCCPNMKHLHLSLSFLTGNPWPQYPSTLDLSSLLMAVQFKALRTLYLSGVHSSPSAAIRFFTKHFTIQNLNIEGSPEFVRDVGSHTTVLEFSGEVLPNLVNLSVPPLFTLSILSHPISLPRPLHRLRLMLWGWDWDLYTDKFFQGLQRHSSLYELHLVIDTLIGPKYLLRLAPALPGIRVIHASLYAAPERPEEYQREWIDAVSAIPTLEVLTGVPLLTNSQHPAIQAHDIAELMARCPQLRQIQKWHRRKQDSGPGATTRYKIYEDVFLRDAAGEPILRPKAPKFRAFCDQILMFGLKARHSSRRWL